MHATPGSRGGGGARGRRRRDPYLRRIRRWWLFTALALAAAASLAIWLLEINAPACASTRPDPTAPREGTAAYHPDWSVVRCSFEDLLPQGYYVSLSTADYAGAALCGAFMDVTGPRGTVRAQIVDRCRGCTGGRIDLSQAAFAQIADLTRGVAPVRYRLIKDPSPVQRLSFMTNPSSTPNWLSLLVMGHGNPITTLELRRPGKPWRPLTRGQDNYWHLSSPGQGPFDARITDTQGHQATIKTLRATPGLIQRTQTPLYAPRNDATISSMKPVPAPVPMSSRSPAPTSAHSCGD